MALPAQSLKATRKIANQNPPFLAPHFTDALLAENKHQLVIQTGLNIGGAQATLERMIARYIENNKNFGIQNVSAMLYDAKTMQVKALVGSADYFNAEIDGQVNGTAAKRSPCLLYTSRCV